MIGLYTSRLAVHLLGLESFGLYGALVSIVVFIGIFHTSLYITAERFLTYYLGLGDVNKLKLNFQNLLFFYLILCLLIVILSETAGLWYVKSHLTINTLSVLSREKTNYAVVAFNFFLLNYIFFILRQPYQILIQAHEKWTTYSTISIAENLLKLILLLLLMRIGTASDNLPYYAAMLMIVSFTGFIASMFYALINFPESGIKPSYEKKFFHELKHFYFADLYSTLALGFQKNAIALLQNKFFGTLANASITVTEQLQIGLNGLTESFTTALKPKLTKNLAVKDNRELLLLLTVGAELGAMLLLLFAIPIYLQTNFILTLWLKTVPPYAEIFVHIVLITMLLDAFFIPLQHTVFSTGKIKQVSLALGSFRLLSFFLAWFMFIAGMPAYTSYLLILFCSFMFYAVLIKLAKKMIPHFNYLPFTKCFIKPFLIGIFICTICQAVDYIVPLGKAFWKIPSGWLSFLCISICSTALWIYAFFYIAFTPKIRGKLTLKLLKTIVTGRN